mgnify:CR=1 FL=1
MKKGKRVELTPDDLARLITMAQEEKKPFEAIKAEFQVPEAEVTEIMRKKLSKDNFELWKKKVAGSKPKPKPAVIDDFEEDLDGKYYLKNKFD